ncbi:MAG: hypothetical protein ABI905_05585 [Betaproteobacteria bacterium]
MRKLLLVSVIAIAGILFYVANRHHDESVGVSATAPTGAGEKLNASAVLKIDLARPTTVPAARAPRVAPSPFTQVYNDRKDWPGLYKQLKAASPTAETQYLLAQLLTACAKRPTAVPPAGSPVRPPDTREERRARFMASLSPKDPQLEKRKTAYDAANGDNCGDIAQVDFDAAEVQKLYEAAAAAGDPRARAVQIARQIEDEARALSSAGQPGPNPRMGAYPISDAQFATIRELLGSQDPAVMAELKGILSSTLVDGSIRLGPNQETVDNMAFHQAWGLVACEFGARCDKTSPEMLAQCASNGHCDADNLYDQTYYYGTSPYAAQLVERYRQQLAQMIASGDFSQLNLARGPNDPGRMFVFGRRGR